MNENMFNVEIIVLNSTT